MPPVPLGPSPAAARAVDRDGPATETDPDEMPGPIVKTTDLATDRGWRATAMMTTIGMNHAAHAAVLRVSVRATVNAAMTGVLAFNPRSATGPVHSLGAAHADLRSAARIARDAGSTVHRAVGPHPLPHVADAALIGEASAGLYRRFGADLRRLPHVMAVVPTVEASVALNRRSGVDPLRLPHVMAVVPIAMVSVGSSLRSAAAHRRSRLAVVPIIGRRSAATGDVVHSRRVMDADSVVPVSVAATKVRSSVAVPSQVVAVHRHSGGERRTAVAGGVKTATTGAVGASAMIATDVLSG